MIRLCFFWGFGVLGIASFGLAKGSLDTAIGKALFQRVWVPSPASTTNADGLGPLYNARACSHCHPGGGAPTGAVSSLKPRRGLVALVAGVNGGQHSQWGEQIQDLASPGWFPEAVLEWHSSEKRLFGRELTSVRSSLKGHQGPITLRIAPPLWGIGWLNRLSDAQIRHQPRRIVGGRSVGQVSEIAAGQVGRFGWKAQQVTIRQQSARAFLMDMGLTSELFPIADGQRQPPGGQRLPGVNEACSGKNCDITEQVLDLVSGYVADLKPPSQPLTKEAARDRGVEAGRDLFRVLQCSSCHRPSWELDASHESGKVKVIWPYSDLLLHDMGSELADHQGFGVLARLWRTPPLWGLGWRLQQAELRQQRIYLLHDGRARGIEEAILWHGGDAKASVQAYVGLSKLQQRQLHEFLMEL